MSIYFVNFKMQNLKHLLNPVPTKNNNYTDNYKDYDISVHTSERYRLFVLSAHASAALNSRARDSRMDSDWVSMFLSFISWKKIILKVIPMILFLSAFIVKAVVWTLRLFNIENDVLNYISIVIFIVIILGVDGPLI